MHQKLAPDPFLILVNNPKQSLHAKISFKNKLFLKRGLSKSLKKVNFIFALNPVSFNGQSYQKQKGPGTSDLSLFRLRNKFTKISLLVIYYLIKFDGVIQSSFWVIPNISPANLCKPIHDIINYSISICPFESGKYWEEEENLQKFEYFDNEKTFSEEIKNIVHSFWRVITWWKNKKMIKNSGHKL